MINAFKLYWTNYFNFRGKTTRRDFWFAVLALVICSFIISIPITILTINKQEVAANIIHGLFGLICFIPSLSMCIRRLRDAGKKWPYIFFGLIPIAGIIILLVAYLKPSAE